MKQEVFGVATLAGEPSSACDVSFGYREEDVATSAKLAGLYARIEMHSGRTCAVHGGIDLAYRESCIADFIEDFVVDGDDPVLFAGDAF